MGGFLDLAPDGRSLDISARALQQVHGWEKRSHGKKAEAGEVLALLFKNLLLQELPQSLKRTISMAELPRT